MVSIKSMFLIFFSIFSLDDKVYVDANPNLNPDGGNCNGWIGSYCNHSFFPNGKLLFDSKRECNKVYPSPNKQFFVKLIEDVKAGEEITVNYGWSNRMYALNHISSPQEELNELKHKMKID